MGYHINDREISLKDLQDRIVDTDLIPSQQPLLTGLSKNIALLEKNGMNCLSDLRIGLKNKKSLATLSESTTIDPQYLNLLRRMVEGFFPKPARLGDLKWVDESILDKLTKAGFKNTKEVYEAASDSTIKFEQHVGLTKKALSEIKAIADLSRIQWVSPLFAKVLVEAGYGSVTKVASADPDALFGATVKANEGARFYKGKVGLRDIKRLIKAASYVG